MTDIFQYIAPFILNILKYFLLAGIPFLIFYVLYPDVFSRNKIQSKNANKKDFIREILHSMQSTFISVSIVLLILKTSLISYTQLYKDLTDYSIWWIPVSALVALIIHDTYFYWMHKTVHHPALYKRIHLIHHKSVSPSPWTSFSFHFFEAIFEAMVVPLILLLIPMSIVSLIIFGFVSFIFNVYGHLGYEIAPKWFRHSFLFQILNTSTHHNIHHAKFKGNYGLYFRVWDRIMRTEHPDYVKEYDKIQEQRFGNSIQSSHSWKTSVLMFFITTLLIFLFSNQSFSQGYFTSNVSGNWNEPASWTLVSGTSTTNYPVAGDSVIVQNGNTINITTNSQCQSLTVKTASVLTLNNTNSILNVSNNVIITEASSITLNAGAFTSIGNLTVNKSSTLTQNGGVISIVGLIFLTAPFSGIGTSLIDIDAGLFACAGGLTITAVTNASRIAELKIGNSVVNIFGLLTTTTANSKITCNGIGALILAGVVTIPNSTSFTAGNGRVVYVGIPGINQNVASVTYNRLVITGVGNGSKTINGSVTVTDTLTLLTDSLLLLSSGVLLLSNNATIVKTAGKLLSTPTFLGQIDILYNNVINDMTGLEMPTATNVLRNLYINNISGITMSSNVTLNNQLVLQNGELNTDNFVLNITNPLGGTSTDPAINRTNGYVNGVINRTIGTSTGVRTFPLGIGLFQGYREFKIDYTTAPSIAGSIIVRHFDTTATAQSGFPLIDGTVTVVNSANYHWQADAMSGLSGGIYKLTLSAEGAEGVTDYATLRLIKRPSAGGAWVLDGVAGTNTGTNTAPTVTRTGLSNFSQFTIGGSSINPLPLKLLSFSGRANDSRIVLDWTTSHEANTDYFLVELSIDGHTFKPEGSVNSVISSLSINHYRYQVKNLVNEISYFRLKMVDIDGNYTYSNIVAITNEMAEELKVYPTVANSTINIFDASSQKVLLYNSSGIFIKYLDNGQNDISNLPTGVYTIKNNYKFARIIKQ